MATQVKPGDIKNYSVVPVDSNGNVATVDTRTPAIHTVSDPTLAEIVSTAPDGLSGQVRALASGVVQVQCPIDADRGDGVREIIGLGDLEILAPEAVTVRVDFSDPV